MEDTETGVNHFDDPNQLSLMGEPAAPAPQQQSASGYRVLARKYRPLTFEDLIGQEAMVRTLSNAFDTGRIPQAWMLTGVRGVGKTTTARILARALNYQLADGTGAPTIHMPNLGVHCEAIMESRHVDVLEMDAASHTGIEDVRQIIDGIRYSPVSARYKVYIIDEVHMLSEKAFNAFLKTLEEPPPHAKFIFATTEIRKVPITILSRCQRFDLRRVEADQLVNHLGRICEKESVSAEPAALSAIALAAEGSVRDSLSLLDQAISHGGGNIVADTVRDMLGLADRTQVIDLFEAVMRGDMPASFAALRNQYNSGADPVVIMSDLASFIHLVTRLKLVPDTAKDPSVTEIERTRGLEFAEKLSVRVLSRAWQILLKGIPEVQNAARPVAAAEMVLVRLAYVADLPTPDEAIRALRNNGRSTAASVSTNGQSARNSAVSNNSAPVNAGQITPSASAQSVPVQSPPPMGGAPTMMAVSGGGRPAPMPVPMSAPTPVPVAQAEQAQPMGGVRLRRFEDVIAYAGEQREMRIKVALESDVHLVHFEEGRIEFRLAEGGSQTLANELARLLHDWTGQRWIVALSSNDGQETVRNVREQKATERRNTVTAHPLVQTILSQFPGAQITDVRDRREEIAPTADPEIDNEPDTGSDFDEL
ncbi:DNA polymerase III subunit gamma/tau [Microvirga sp. W0021]|uniref:DNA polymerase III subunit gamma/tau n=1 Tax=Hohaiivirga grylli TaxID=3133970 RepID=A0ABV0BGM1_9HYPH